MIHLKNQLKVVSINHIYQDNKTNNKQHTRNITGCLNLKSHHRVKIRGIHIIAYIVEEILFISGFKNIYILIFFDFHNFFSQEAA